MESLILIIIGVASFLFASNLLSNNYQNVAKEPCPPHKWQYLEVNKVSRMKCTKCNYTPSIED